MTGSCAKGRKPHRRASPRSGRRTLRAEPRSKRLRTAGAPCAASCLCELAKAPTASPAAGRSARRLGATSAPATDARRRRAPHERHDQPQRAWQLARSCRSKALPAPCVHRGPSPSDCGVFGQGMGALLPLLPVRPSPLVRHHHRGSHHSRVPRWDVPAQQHPAGVRELQLHDGWRDSEGSVSFVERHFVAICRALFFVICALAFARGRGCF
jgi:hypothetical protein